MEMETTDNQHDFSYPIYGGKREEKSNYIPVVNGPCAGQRWKDSGSYIHLETDTGSDIYERINDRWVFRFSNPNIQKKSETVDHPSHYNQYGVECVDVAEKMNFNMGNALKYIWRCGHKGNPIEDLKKAKWYIERELQRLENE